MLRTETHLYNHRDFFKYLCDCAINYPDYGFNVMDEDFWPNVRLVWDIGFFLGDKFLVAGEVYRTDKTSKQLSGFGMNDNHKKGTQTTIHFKVQYEDLVRYAQHIHDNIWNDSNKLRPEIQRKQILALLKKAYKQYGAKLTVNEKILGPFQSDCYGATDTVHNGEVEYSFNQTVLELEKEGYLEINHYYFDAGAAASVVNPADAVAADAARSQGLVEVFEYYPAQHCNFDVVLLPKLTGTAVTRKQKDTLFSIGSEESEYAQLPKEAFPLTGSPKWVLTEFIEHNHAALFYEGIAQYVFKGLENPSYKLFKVLWETHPKGVGTKENLYKQAYGEPHPGESGGKVKKLNDQKLRRPLYQLNNRLASKKCDVEIKSTGIPSLTFLVS